MILAYLFAAIMILTLFYLAKKNQKEGWRKQRPQPIRFAVDSYKSEPASPEIDYESNPLGHLKELENLNRALTGYHVPQKPAVAIPVPIPVSVKGRKEVA
jgi:hypothetical protein